MQLLTAAQPNTTLLCLTRKKSLFSSLISLANVNKCLKISGSIDFRSMCLSAVDLQNSLRISHLLCNGSKQSIKRKHIEDKESLV